ncbi:HAD family hydrolase [Propionivibrio limicola]|uniref:HAD family hydrolase n=1 Tax=Propionivibrio limicola TaxID=167645 RepID=UPI001291B6E3|nr:HAD family hydrolase [Propionivibrio limicola]
MTHDIAAVIFDCDGTLVDSETPGLDVLHAEAVKIGAAIERDEIHARFRGKRMMWCAGVVGERLANKPNDFEDGFTKQVRAAMTVRFREGLDPLPGAFDLLRRLQIPFCVASNGPREKMELTLGQCGLWPLVSDRIFSAYEVGSFKPDPGLFLHAAAALGVEPARCAVIEDSLPGVQAGLAAGMQVFSLHPQPGLPAELADRVRFIDSLVELDRLLHGQA